MTQIEYLLCEAERCGEIDLDTRDAMLQAYTESVFSKANPLKKFLEKTKEIKDVKPRDYDGPKEVKKFVDEYYDDIEKIAKILEKEPDKIRRSEIKYVIKTTIAFIASLFIPFGTLLLIILCIHSMIRAVVHYNRIANDRKITDDLSKIKAALKKVNTSRLKQEYRNKISDMITDIDDAETEMNVRFKVTNESTIDDMKITIYEKELAGEITAEEREDLLTHLESRLV